MNYHESALMPSSMSESPDYTLSTEQLCFWKDHGYLRITDYFTSGEKALLAKWCEELEALPEMPGKWMKYFEKNDKNEKQLCRIENFLDYHAPTDWLARGHRTLDLVSSLMGEEAALFKEKINLKLPGGNGFTPHQDAPAFISFNQKYHITMMVAIDDSTLENGCLQLAVNATREQSTYPRKVDGSIQDDIVNTLAWKPVECERGDILLFDSYLPHYSKPNLSNRSRRAFFLTYNRFSEGGSRRHDYFMDKRNKFPPDCERDPYRDYSEGAAIYNVANPFPSGADNTTC